MSSDWVNSLNQTLTSLKKNKLPRIALVGIGQELRGDDAAGVMAVRALKPAFIHQQDVLIIDGGQAPENLTGMLRHFAPDFVLFIDAAQMDESIGSVQWLSWQETIGLSASTHTLPLHIIAQYLSTELGCEIALIGIQPAQTHLGAGLSSPVKQSVDRIVQSLTYALGT